MSEVRENIESAANDNLPVLLMGESGTGKETLGRFLHSLRGDEPFLKVNCGAEPSNLLEEKIFGAQSLMDGAGPQNDGGLSRLATFGTLYLNEVDGLGSSLQWKIARALASERRLPIHGLEKTGINARLIGGTTIDLEAELESRILDELLGCFVHHIRLLPLRERREDIPLLCEYLLEKFAQDFGRPVPHLGSRVVEALQEWKWPGNIRELENWIARIVIFGEEVVDLEFRRQLTVGPPSASKFRRVSHFTARRVNRPRSHR